MNDIVFYGIWAVVSIIIFVYYVKRKRSFVSSVVGMGTGMIALLIMHFFGSTIGYSPQLNLFNTMTALVLGVPGVIMMTVVNIFL
jgi:hypothetical protein